MRTTPDDSGLPDSVASSTLGQSYRTGDCYVVGREKVREFARAVQDDHPVHHCERTAVDRGYGGLVAPLTFVSVPALLAQLEMFDRVIQGCDLSQITQTDYSLTVGRPIFVGDSLRFEVELDGPERHSEATSSLSSVRSSTSTATGSSPRARHSSAGRRRTSPRRE
ncbi:MaoC family dehydratase N-terminal domain-containing protein [Nocardia salmonicida]|uniref:FAS1-like dehydratase domain-containing protein n=1 Tax=Nocardia salmonicida TaxID=53431 RepID=UPI0033FC2C9E